MGRDLPVQTGCLATHRREGGTFLVTAFRYRTMSRGLEPEYEILDPSTGRFRWVPDFSLMRLPEPASDNT